MKYKAFSSPGFCMNLFLFLYSLFDSLFFLILGIIYSQNENSILFFLILRNQWGRCFLALRPH